MHLPVSLLPLSNVAYTLQCLVQVALSDPGVSPALAHLILDTLAELEAAERGQPAAAEQQQAGEQQQAPPSRANAARDGPARDGSAATPCQLHAARVLLACCASQPRLAPKVAAVFRLAAGHLSVEQQGQLLDAISALLDVNTTSACGVSLLLHPGFATLRRHFHLEAVLEDLVLSSQDPVAVKLVRELGSREMQAGGRGIEGCRAAQGQQRPYQHLKSPSLPARHVSRVAEPAQSLLRAVSDCPSRSRCRRGELLLPACLV